MNEYLSVLGQDSGIELQDGSTNPQFRITTTDQTPTRELRPETETELKGEEKTIIFPPVAIANHLPPDVGEWQASLLCPLCDDYYYEEQGDDDMDRVRWTQDERGFETVASLQEHLEWTHANLLETAAPKSSSCAVM